MTLWIGIAVLLGLCLFAMLRALRARSVTTSAETTDAAFYRTQLAEIDRQLGLGQIGEVEAEAARAEAARRLIAAGRNAQDTPVVDGRMRRLAVVFVLSVVPLVALALYARIGSPELPAAPLAERLAQRPAGLDLDAAVAKIEAHLSQNPDDGRGYAVIAPVYMRMGRYDDAIRSFREALRLNGETAALQADLGEAIVAQQNGIVSADARATFDRAVTLDAKYLKARFYLSQAAEQDGDKPKALAMLQAMREDAKEPALIARLDQDIARLGGSVPKGGETIAALPEAERMQAIRGMVEGLDARLASEGGGPVEWARLVRAYTVLKDDAKAAQALKRAREALSASAESLTQFNAAIADLGIAAKPDN